jgi:hypothetical protein
MTERVHLGSKVVQTGARRVPLRLPCLASDSGKERREGAAVLDPRKQPDPVADAQARPEPGPTAGVTWAVRFAGLPERRALAHLSNDQRSTLCGFRIPRVGDAGVESLDVTHGELAARVPGCLVCLAHDREGDKVRGQGDYAESFGR